VPGGRSEPVGRSSDGGTSPRSGGGAEAAGGTSEEPFDLAVRATARAGRLITLGSFGSPALRLRQGDVKTGEMAILGSQAHPNSFPDTIAGIADGKLPVEELITHRLPMSEVEEAFRLLADRSSGAVKIVLRPPGSRGDDVR
jgi:threonine dehydrogenase-like Zn-dependent dehydrogenase